MYKKIIKRGENEYTYYYTNVRKEGKVKNIETIKKKSLLNHDDAINSINSFVDIPNPISNNNSSYVQTLQFNFNASATNSTSLRCSFNNCLALGINSLYSSNSINDMFSSNNFNNISNSDSESFDLNNISFLLLLNSSISFFGANICNLGLNIISSMLPWDIRVLNNTFESNTISNYTNPLFLSPLSMDDLTLSDNISASSSLNFDLEIIDLNNLYSFIFLSIAPLAISDQFNSGIDSISCFNSFGMASVNVGISLPPTVNTHNYVQVFKFFGVKIE